METPSTTNNFERLSNPQLVSYLQKNSKPEYLHDRELNGMPRFIANKFSKEALVAFCNELTALTEAEKLQKEKKEKEIALQAQVDSEVLHERNSTAIYIDEILFTITTYLPSISKFALCTKWMMMKFVNFRSPFKDICTSHPKVIKNIFQGTRNSFSLYCHQAKYYEHTARYNYLNCKELSMLWQTIEDRIQQQSRVRMIKVPFKNLYVYDWEKFYVSLHLALELKSLYDKLRDLIDYSNLRNSYVYKKEEEVEEDNYNMPFALQTTLYAMNERSLASALGSSYTFQLHGSFTKILTQEIEHCDLNYTRNYEVDKAKAISAIESFEAQYEIKYYTVLPTVLVKGMDNMPDSLQGMSPMHLVMGLDRSGSLFGLSLGRLRVKIYEKLVDRERNFNQFWKYKAPSKVYNSRNFG